MYQTDDDCLQEIFNSRYGKVKSCPRCHTTTKFYKVKNRQCFECEWCGHQLYPLADTIFHKTRTPLKLWFFAIFLFSKSKNGVSSKELQRQLCTTYKTAWRMAKQIRILFEIYPGLLGNTVEVDETYVGGKTIKYGGKRKEPKIPVVGMIERGGNVIAEVTKSNNAKTLIALIRENIKAGTRIITDGWAAYTFIPWKYTHESVNHHKYEWVRGDVYTNTIENFFSTLKRTLRGTYIHVSKKHLQSYVNEVAWRYNHRNSSSFFQDMMVEAVRPSL